MGSFIHGVFIMTGLRVWSIRGKGLHILATQKATLAPFCSEQSSASPQRRRPASAGELAAAFDGGANALDAAVAKLRRAWKALGTSKDGPCLDYQTKVCM